MSRGPSPLLSGCSRRAAPGLGLIAASLCNGARFNGDAAITSVAAAMVLISRKGAEDAFFSAIKANIDDMSAKGREAWCSATTKAAKQRNSETLTEDNDAAEGN
jgi:hypothetical protein